MIQEPKGRRESEGANYCQSPATEHQAFLDELSKGNSEEMEYPYIFPNGETMYFSHTAETAKSAKFPSQTLGYFLI